MVLCHRGCGLEATYVTGKGQPCCDIRAQRCPTVKKKIGDNSGATRRKSPIKHSEESRLRRSIAIKEAWSSGRKFASDSHIAHSKELHKFRDNAWNKGLDLSDPRVAKYANKQRGKKKEALRPIIPHDDPVYNDFKKYRNRVATRTRHSYEMNKSIINPNNFQLGRAGIDGAYHIDHIVSVKYGFIHSIPIELISDPSNLRMMPWRENIQKYSNTDEAKMPIKITEYLKRKDV